MLSPMSPSGGSLNVGVVWEIPDTTPLVTGQALWVLIHFQPDPISLIWISLCNDSFLLLTSKQITFFLFGFRNKLNIDMHKWNNRSLSAILSNLSIRAGPDNTQGSRPVGRTQNLCPCYTRLLPADKTRVDVSLPYCSISFDSVKLGIKNWCSIARISHTSFLLSPLLFGPYQSY